MSAHITSVGQSFTLISPKSTLSLMKKNFALICFIFFELENRPLTYKSWALTLSWWSSTNSTSYPWWIKYSNHNISGMYASSAFGHVRVNCDKLCLRRTPLVKLDLY